MLLAGILFAPCLRAATPDPVTAQFSAYDPTSRIRLDHSPWNAFLAAVVLDVGRSTRRIGRGKPQQKIGSHLTYGNPSPSRFENNRVLFHRFKRSHRELLRRHREGLEHLPERVPLAALNRAEQLAFWLNLYNAALMEQIVERYPVQKLKTWRRDKADDLWHRKRLQVAGTALSLRDIETKILFPIWHNPLVLYGLWQGAIGGPRLPNRAYTGANVWRLLDGNAREFVNSNRGMRPEGGTLYLSLLYRWGAPLFPGDHALIRHILRYAQPPFSRDLDGVDSVVYGLYDWHIADLIDGTTDPGQWSQLGGLLSGTFGTANDLNRLLSLAQQKDATLHSEPPQAIRLLKGILANNSHDRTPRVTVEECRSGKLCPPPVISTPDPEPGQGSNRR